MNHRVLLTKRGKTKIVFDCPGCSMELACSLLDAGTCDTCPTCGTTFTVPGETEKNTYLEKQRLYKQQQEGREPAADTAPQADAVEQAKRIEAEAARRLQENMVRDAAAEAHPEAYRLNLWAWRLFMVGVVFTFLGGIGLFFQIPALCLAARASSISHGAYGERLWRGVRNWFIFLVLLVVLGAIAGVVLVFFDKETHEKWQAAKASAAVMLAVGLLGLWQWRVYRWGIQHDQ